MPLFKIIVEENVYLRLSPSLTFRISSTTPVFIVHGICRKIYGALKRRKLKLNDEKRGRSQKPFKDILVHVLVPMCSRGNKDSLAN